jgi:hypothetical protein
VHARARQDAKKCETTSRFRACTALRSRAAALQRAKKRARWSILSSSSSSSLSSSRAGVMVPRAVVCGGLSQSPLQLWKANGLFSIGDVRLVCTSPRRWQCVLYVHVCVACALHEFGASRKVYTVPYDKGGVFTTREAEAARAQPRW